MVRREEWFDTPKNGSTPSKNGSTPPQPPLILEGEPDYPCFRWLIALASGDYVCSSLNCLHIYSLWTRKK